MNNQENNQKEQDEKKPENASKDNNQNTEALPQEIFEIFYSPYGYVKINKKELENENSNLYNFVKYGENKTNEEKCLIGTINKNNLKSNIDISIKKFTGARKPISIKNKNINSKLYSIIENLSDYDKKEGGWHISKNSQYNIYSSKSGIRELNNGLNFYENNVVDKEILLYFKETPLTFSNTMKGKSIELSNNYKTALKINTDDPQYALGKTSYFSGRHYFEISLLTEPMIRSIIVGLCNKYDDRNDLSPDIKNFYGFILSDMKKMKFLENREEILEDYGEICNINDNIGVLFDCKYDGVYVSFYRNKKCLGVAYEKLPKNKNYYPCVQLGFCGSKIKITNELDFPES